MTRQRRLRAPFVVTAALTAAGCGGSVSSDGGGQPSACPNAAPDSAAACSISGLVCSYHDTNACGFALLDTATCGKDLVWSVSSKQLQPGGCNPPPPPTDVCPTAEPTVGGYCNVVDTKYCEYPSGCCSASYQCQNSAWEAIPMSCNPPALVCPDSPPSDGTACDSCAYQSEPCSWDGCADGGTFATATCDNGAWSVQSQPCAGAGDGGV
jgi:hypothetical protein